ncbi:hypothetical protein Bca4012_013631 [Brassica carinata]
MSPFPFLFTSPVDISSSSSSCYKSLQLFLLSLQISNFFNLLLGLQAVSLLLVLQYHGFAFSVLHIISSFQ